jgi:hypothetical protein
MMQTWLERLRREQEAASPGAAAGDGGHDAPA